VGSGAAVTPKRAFLALALLVLAPAAFFTLREKSRLVRVAVAHRGPLRLAVSCAGVLQPPAGGELRAPGAATVARLLVPEGASVGRGDALVVLSDPDLVARKRQAREEVLELEAEAATAAGEASQARKELERLRERASADRRLLEAGALTRADSEASAAEARAAEARLSSAEARVRSLDAGTPGGPARLALARARAADLAARVDGLTLRAPAEGVVYGLPRREGEAVAAGQVLANVTEPGHPEVRVKVDQPDLPRVAEGQHIVVSFDGLPERRFEGTLWSVSRGLRESGGREVAEVLGRIQDPDRLLPWNASVSVEVVVLERASTLLVPRAALQRDGDQRIVYVADGGRARRREVEVGAVSTNEAEVEGGLQEGEGVVLAGGAPLHDGAAIRVAAP